VFSSDGKGNKSIVDGQQRITSLTLLLIYLNHRQKNFTEENKVQISNLIYSVKFGTKSFNMLDDDRKECLTALFEKGFYEPSESDDETIKNLAERYNNIRDSFPEEINDTALPYFIDWLIENVVLVEIIAYSSDNAYTIFETMNDRGLNLTPTEMLKGYVLSKISDRKQRGEINDIWKRQVQKLHEYDDKADLSFFPAWFRGKYAQSIRPGKAGSENQDFENVSPAFHRWFRDRHSDLFGLNTSQEFYNFFKHDFPFFVSVYLQMWDACITFDPQLDSVYYMSKWGIAESLNEPLLLAPVKIGDKPEIVIKKLNFTARYIEIFTVRRSVNYKNFGQATIKYTMFNIVKAIRDCDLPALGTVLSTAVDDITERWDGIERFMLHGMNRRFVKHLLSRITCHVDEIAGKNSMYTSYQTTNGKTFEIEHIWADKFNEHRDEFDQASEFKDWRNSIGALLLLPQGTNQSFNSDKYEQKLKHYIKENTYAQTLNPLFYEKNPNFLNSPLAQKLSFKAHPHFKTDDILERQALVQRICEQIWSTDYFFELG
jgi:hypothetical protein